MAAVVEPAGAGQLLHLREGPFQALTDLPQRQGAKAGGVKDRPTGRHHHQLAVGRGVASLAVHRPDRTGGQEVSADDGVGDRGLAGT